MKWRFSLGLPAEGSDFLPSPVAPNTIFALGRDGEDAALIAVMPRSGGDYIWQSRILGGAVGFILAVTGWWFILWLWVPLYGQMLTYEFLTPMAALLGAPETALWFTGTSEGQHRTFSTESDRFTLGADYALDRMRGKRECALICPLLNSIQVCS